MSPQTQGPNVSAPPPASSRPPHIWIAVRTTQPLSASCGDGSVPGRQLWITPGNVGPTCFNSHPPRRAGEVAARRAANGAQRHRRPQASTQPADRVPTRIALRAFRPPNQGNSESNPVLAGARIGQTVNKPLKLCSPNGKMSAQSTAYAHTPGGLALLPTHAHRPAASCPSRAPSACPPSTRPPSTADSARSECPPTQHPPRPSADSTRRPTTPGPATDSTGKPYRHSGCQRNATTTADSGGRSTRSRWMATPGSVANRTLLGTALKLTVCGTAAKLAATAH